MRTVQDGQWMMINHCFEKGTDGWWQWCAVVHIYIYNYCFMTVVNSGDQPCSIVIDEMKIRCGFRRLAVTDRIMQPLISSNNNNNIQPHRCATANWRYGPVFAYPLIPTRCPHLFYTLERRSQRIMGREPTVLWAYRCGTQPSWSLKQVVSANRDGWCPKINGFPRSQSV